MLKGSIRQRGDKFQVLFPYKDEYGEWKQKSKTCKTMTLAKAALKTFNFETDVALDNPRLSVVADLWIKEVSLHGSSNTIWIYEKNSEFIIERIGDMKIKDITRNDVVKLYQSIKGEGYETKAYVSCFNMMMNFAIRSNYIKANVGKGITVTRTKEKRPVRILNQTERINLLRSVEGTTYYYVIYLLLKTGLRIGESLGLEWSAIDLDEGIIEVRQQVLNTNEITAKLKSKNSKRTIFLDTETIDMLNELKHSPFTTFTLIFEEYKSVRSVLANILRKHKCTPHDLRHNHGTDLLDICNIADAAQRMGHTVEEYVSTYIHPSDDSQREIANKLNNKIYSLCDNLVTEHRGKVVKMARTNG